MYYDIIIKSKTSFTDNIYTYHSNEDIKIGSRVIIPFGKGDRKTLGFVIDKKEKLDKDFATKDIVEIIDYKPLVSDKMLKLAKYMVEKDLSDYSNAIQTIMPPGGIGDIVEFYEIYDDKELEDDELVAFLKEGRSFEDISNKFKNKYSRSFLNGLVEDKILTSYYDKIKKSSIKYEITYDLIDLNYKDKLAKNALKQKALADYLKDKGSSERGELLRATQASSSSLKSLVDKEIIRESQTRVFRKVLEEDYKTYDKLSLNEQQEEVYRTIVESDDKLFLLHGITGSGKTEVYLHLVEREMAQDKTSIILVPEISLTPQTIERFQGRFGNKIAVLHSKLSVSERADQWRLIKNGQVDIVVGARSAIFAPLENLGMVIIDEEHESSYRSDKNPKYSAIEIAEELSKLTGCKVVLGSATPSVNSMYKVSQKKYNLLQLSKRANNTRLPQSYIIDMRDELKSKNYSMFSNLLQEKIEGALAKKETVILFLNKRGHTSFVFCRSCGYIYRCEACDVSMTYHKTNNRLVCHYCGRTAVKTRSCSNCGSPYIKEFGAGTQMLEEETKKLFPQARVVRMDADTTSTKKAYDQIYEKMKNQEVDILIGTQMLAKGFDFPNVTLVGIMAADISLNLPDFRASEKTYQLITQVSGRAGRGNKEGSVIIQTYKPENFAIQAAAKNDYYGFFEEEIGNRRQFSYPPFNNILLINTSHKDRTRAINKSRQMMLLINRYIKYKNLKIEELTGPTPSVIERINNYYRFNIIIKSKSKDDLLELAKFIKEEYRRGSDLYINYTINPESIY